MSLVLPEHSACSSDVNCWRGGAVEAASSHSCSVAVVVEKLRQTPQLSARIHRVGPGDGHLVFNYAASCRFELMQEWETCHSQISSSQ
jgi:hypothetical protein